MSITDIVGVLKEGGFVGVAALFLYLYMSERKSHSETQKARLDDTQKQIAEQAKTGEAMRVTMADMARSMDANTTAMEASLRQHGGRR